MGASCSAGLIVPVMFRTGTPPRRPSITRATYNAGDAVIFGVRPEVVGPVDVEVWEGVPDQALEHVLCSERLDEGAERILLSDPNDVVSVEFDGSPEKIIVEVRVDDVDWLEKVQVIVSPDVAR
jgi:hypothetical protein